MVNLNESRIEAGLQLLPLLEKQFDVRVCLWLYDQGSDSWSLVVSSSEYEAQGPKELYRRTQLILRNWSLKDDISLSEVVFLPLDNQLIQLLRSALHTGDKPEKIRFTGNVINGTVIDDALVYRVA